MASPNVLLRLVHFVWTKWDESSHAETFRCLSAASKKCLPTYLMVCLRGRGSCFVVWINECEMNGLRPHVQNLVVFVAPVCVQGARRHISAHQLRLYYFLLNPPQPRPPGLCVTPVSSAVELTSADMWWELKHRRTVDSSISFRLSSIRSDLFFLLQFAVGCTSNDDENDPRLLSAWFDFYSKHEIKKRKTFTQLDTNHNITRLKKYIYILYVCVCVC